jgi:peptidoglycan/xylan/chitin deacetylase (PgdA/CDA1 family)
MQQKTNTGAHNNNTPKPHIRFFQWQFSTADYFYPLLIFITSVDSLDWKDYGVDSIIQTVTQHKHLGNGSIILCHNGAKYTAQALDTLITTLQDQGYELVPISQLIYRDNYHLDVEGRQISAE